MVFITKESKNLQIYRGRRIFTASARAAMTFILQFSKRLDNRGILLPSYLGQSKIEGSGVFDPIRATNFKYGFYRVDQHLRPDLIAVEELLRSGNFQLVFLIHYFGLPQVDVAQFVALCRDYKAKVIEDCAHTLLGGLKGRTLGSYGDYAIFSIHKSTAAINGGFLIDNTGNLNALTMPEKFRISLEALTEFADTDLLAASLQRLHNYHTVAGWLSSIPQLEPLFKSIPLGAVPLNCPVLVRDGKREQLYFKLIERGVFPTALYHTLIPEISLDLFPQSHFVAANILNLPTHADISNKDLDRYRHTLRETVTEVFSK